MLSVESVASVLVPETCHNTTSSNGRWEAEAAGRGILLLLQTVSAKAGFAVSILAETHRCEARSHTTPTVQKNHRRRSQTHIRASRGVQMRLCVFLSLLWILLRLVTHTQTKQQTVVLQVTQYRHLLL